MVPDCLQCHSEFYRTTKMPSDQVDARRGVECATCHGDGKAHCEQPTKTNIGAGSLDICLTCHDEEHSPKFDPKTGWEKIKH